MLRAHLEPNLLLDADLGTFPQGSQHVATRALVVARLGNPELFLEFTSTPSGSNTASTAYFHLPADGHDTVRSLARTLQTGGSGLAPTRPIERGVAPFLWILQTIQAGMPTFSKVAFAAVVISLLLAPFDLPAWMSLRPVLLVALPLTILGFFVVFLGSVVGARLLARLFEEPVAIGHVRLVHGPARNVQRLGTWQPAAWPTPEHNTVLAASLHACIAVSAPPRLVVACTRRSPTAHGSEVFALHPTQVPALLTVLDRMNGLRPEAAALSARTSAASPGSGSAPHSAGSPSS